MNIQNYSVDETLTAVKNWSEEADNESFDCSFIDSLTESFETYGNLTDRQFEALENIVERFHIDISEHL